MNKEFEVLRSDCNVKEDILDSSARYWFLPEELYDNNSETKVTVKDIPKILKDSDDTEVNWDDYYDIYSEICPILGAEQAISEYNPCQCTFGDELFNNFEKYHPDTVDGYYFDDELKTKVSVNDAIIEYLEGLCKEDKTEIMNKCCTKCPLREVIKTNFL